MSVPRRRTAGSFRSVSRFFLTALAAFASRYNGLPGNLSRAIESPADRATGSRFSGGLDVSGGRLVDGGTVRQSQPCGKVTTGKQCGTADRRSKIG